MPKLQDATRKIWYWEIEAIKECIHCLAIFSVIILFIIAQPVCADPGVAEPPVGPSKEQPGAGSEVPSSAKAPDVADAINSSVGAMPEWFPKVIGGQFNGIFQNMPHFRNPYEGYNSLKWDKGYGQNITHIYGIYLGSQITGSLQGYLDVEMARGKGLNEGVGLGGYTNGDAIRTGSAELGQDPYVARMYLRYIVPLSHDTGRLESTSQVERAQDQLPGNEPLYRLEIRGGKMAAPDVFDLNRYANNTRTQFLDYDFINNATYDYAADTRGYSYGFTVAYVQPSWQLAYGCFMVVTTANGYKFDTQIAKSNGNNLELTLKPNDKGPVIRLLTFYNQGRMGSYSEAIKIGQTANAAPDVINDETSGRNKYGFGVNLEQPIADDGETGVFARLGWNDGHNEDFMYTEVDRNLAGGLQISGAHWGRTEDRLGIAYALNGLSQLHKDYLGAGGFGFMLDDGKLNYGLEQIFETYYRIQFWRFIQVSPAFQFIQNPGYNRDRGPVEVYSVRVRLYF